MHIIPQPYFWEERPGAFELTEATVIIPDHSNQTNAEYLRNLLILPTGYLMPVENQNLRRTPAIILNTNPDLSYLGNEGYKLLVSPEEIRIEGANPTGIFYGMQSLRQLLPAEIETGIFIPNRNWQVNSVLIIDKPRFAWRGFMLDEGRHFQGKKTVLETLNLMAVQKMNVFHWHLTDDQGWRIEIIRHPELSRNSSYRPGTSTSFFKNNNDGIPHGGYYTQSDIHEIVKFASEHHITIVPEVEMPGHSLAALAAYPELSCTGGPFTVATHFGIFEDIYCAGKETVFSFLEDVLSEVMENFPSKYIHIGGDEAPKKRWNDCEDCKQRIMQEGLYNTHSLQLYFINRMADYIEMNGRHAIVWNDMLQNGLNPQIAVQFWIRGRKRLICAIRNERRNTIMSTYLDTYLDHSHNLLSLSRAYHFEPVPKELEENETGSIMGLEVPLWTEWVPTKARLDYQIYPRITAAAENGWTFPERKDFSNFQNRLPSFLQRLDRIGVAYAPLREAEPSKIKQIFGVLTIPMPQTGVAENNTKQSAIL